MIVIPFDPVSLVTSMSQELTIVSAVAVSVFFILVLILKGCAMYRAARKESKAWFWFLLIFNTMGILPLLYLIFSKKEENSQ